MTQLFIGFLDGLLGPKLFAAVVLLYAAYRIRTIKKVFGGAAATLGLLGTVGAGVFISYGVALAMGWVDVYPGEIVGDVSAAAQTAWEYGLDILVEKLVNMIEGVADGG